MSITAVILIGTLFLLSSCQSGYREESSRPNIILIMADDMGFSDIGCYGGEIRTPNLDDLAANGLRFSQFYNGARCCPTRATLMTGLAPHQTGIGWMTSSNLGHEGYTGELNRECLTLAEVLKTAGYSAYLSGKWHLTAEHNARQEGDRSNWPLQRGFDRFFGTILGSGSFYTPASLALGNDLVDPEEGFFYTDAIVSNAITFLGDHVENHDNPFFLYVAFTSPHWPLHARDSVISRYIEDYRVGWDSVRMTRYQRMIEMGLVSPGWDLSTRDEDAPEWNTLDAGRQEDMVKRMATYAAQIEEMDMNIGRLTSFLVENKMLNNTLILFLADNGGCAEYISSGEDRSTEGIGSAASFESYRLPWANASNTPFRLFKHWVHEGGISTPLIVHWPGKIEGSGNWVGDPAQLADIMPTLIDLADASYPETFEGNSIQPIEGSSLLPVFLGDSDLTERTLFWEHEANRAVRKGKWKLVSRGNTEYPFTGDWELYDMDQDRTETNDLAEQYPELVEKLSGSWDAWAESHRVYPLDGREWNDRLRNPVFIQPGD